MFLLGTRRGRMGKEKTEGEGVATRGDGGEYSVDDGGLGDGGWRQGPALWEKTVKRGRKGSKANSGCGRQPTTKGKGEGHEEGGRKGGWRWRREGKWHLGALARGWGRGTGSEDRMPERRAVRRGVDGGFSVDGEWAEGWCRQLRWEGKLARGESR